MKGDTELTARQVDEMQLEGKFSSGDPGKGDPIPGTTAGNSNNTAVKNE